MACNHPSKTIMDDETLSRFLDKVEVNQDTGCWIWVASLNRHGYGQFNCGGTMILAHRVSFEHFVEDPDGLQVRHKCPCGANKKCVNPEHLRLGTNEDNVLDRKSEGGYMSAKAVAMEKYLLSENDVSAIRAMHLTGRFSNSEISGLFNIESLCVELSLRGLRNGK